MASHVPGRILKVHRAAGLGPRRLLAALRHILRCWRSSAFLGYLGVAGRHDAASSADVLAALDHPAHRLHMAVLAPLNAGRPTRPSPAT